MSLLGFIIRTLLVCKHVMCFFNDIKWINDYSVTPFRMKRFAFGVYNDVLYVIGGKRRVNSTTITEPEILMYDIKRDSWDVHDTILPFGFDIDSRRFTTLDECVYWYTNGKVFKFNMSSGELNELSNNGDFIVSPGDACFTIARNTETQTDYLYAYDGRWYKNPTWKLDITNENSTWETGPNSQLQRVKPYCGYYGKVSFAVGGNHFTSFGLNHSNSASQVYIGNIPFGFLASNSAQRKNTYSSPAEVFSFVKIDEWIFTSTFRTNPRYIVWDTSGGKDGDVYAVDGNDEFYVTEGAIVYDKDNKVLLRIGGFMYDTSLNNIRMSDLISLGCIYNDTGRISTHPRCLTNTPTLMPTNNPTIISENPSLSPTINTLAPSLSPSIATNDPTIITNKPTMMTNDPTSQPSNNPTGTDHIYCTENNPYIFCEEFNNGMSLWNVGDQSFSSINIVSDHLCHNCLLMIPNNTDPSIIYAETFVNLQSNQRYLQILFDAHININSETEYGGINYKCDNDIIYHNGTKLKSTMWYHNMSINTIYCSNTITIRLYGYISSPQSSIYFDNIRIIAIEPEPTQSPSETPTYTSMNNPNKASSINQRTARIFIIIGLIVLCILAIMLVIFIRLWRTIKAKAAKAASLPRSIDINNYPNAKVAITSVSTTNAITPMGEENVVKMEKEIYQFKAVKNMSYFLDDRRNTQATDAFSNISNENIEGNPQETTNNMDQITKGGDNHQINHGNIQENIQVNNNPNNDGNDTIIDDNLDEMLAYVTKE